MAAISLCMIVKDEEEVLARCLNSIKDLVDEIIIVDTGSSDRTVKIAGGFTDRIFFFSWTDDFSAARNFALEQAEMEFCMWMDADDIFPAQYADEFRKLKEGLDEKTDVVMMPYETGFDSKGRPVFIYERERIFRNHPIFRFRGKVHEAVTPVGNVIHTQIPVCHKKTKAGDPDRNLLIYKKMEENGEWFDSRSMYYYGRELAAHERYVKAEQIFEKFLICDDGWRENKIDAVRQLAFCRYRLGKGEQALETLFRSFVFDVPRGEICCDIGRHFLDRERYREAVYWLEQALRAERKLNSGAFIQEECYGYLPAILLCVCYDRMGNTEKAEEMNELAGSFCPESEYYAANKEYFRKKYQEQKITKDEAEHIL